jgi:lysophospholipase L1-like esterase
MSEARGSLRARLLLVVFGVMLALVIGLALVILFPELLPAEATTTRYDRLYGGSSYEVEFRVTDGDMFTFYGNSIRPPEDDALLQRFTLTWDEDGFRSPALPADAFPIAAFGDSYTEGYTVPMPWPDLLAENLGVPVRNYGYRGYSPIETARAVEEFANAEPRTWVIYMFFSGNDLGEITRAIREPINGRDPRYLIGFLAENASENVQAAVEEAARDHYDYPTPVIIGGNFYELVFLDLYLWSQMAPPQGFAASRNGEILNASLDQMEAAVAPETCLAFVFAPNRAQLYFKYVYPTERQWLIGLWKDQVIDGDGLIQQIEAPPPPDADAIIEARLDEQHQFIREVMAERPRWHIIDLLPEFAEHVAQGELLYFTHDTHWNPQGHALAAQIIADGLRAASNCALG